MSTKDTNPKDAVGSKKAPLDNVSVPVMMEVGLGMLEGALKYGRHNYRVYGVRASVYYNAALRHLGAWWEGENIDPDSGLSHVTKAIASLVVLRDAMIRGMCYDDRPPGTAGFIADLNKKAEEIVARYPNAKAPYLGIEHPAANYLKDEVHDDATDGSRDGGEVRQPAEGVGGNRDSGNDASESDQEGDWGDWGDYLNP